MKYTVEFTNQFKKDIKKAEKQGKNIDDLFQVVGRIANGETLDDVLVESFATIREAAYRIIGEKVSKFCLFFYYCTLFSWAN